MRIKPIEGWILIYLDKYGEGVWGIASCDVFDRRKDALEFAARHGWPKPYRAVRGKLSVTSRHSDGEGNG